MNHRQWLTEKVKWVHGVTIAVKQSIFFICFIGTKRADLTFNGFMAVDAVPANGCRALTSLDRVIGVVNAGLFSPAYAVVGMGKVSALIRT